MCESHVNNAIRSTADVKKVSSSHSKGETVIIAEDDIDDSILTEAISKQGYKITSVEKEPYEKKGLFSFGRKK